MWLFLISYHSHSKI